MIINFNCVYCNSKNKVDIANIDEYQTCHNCNGLLDIEVTDDDKVIVEAF